jgi:hypothetical protein
MIVVLEDPAPDNDRPSQVVVGVIMTVVRAAFITVMVMVIVVAVVDLGGCR